MCNNINVNIITNICVHSITAGQKISVRKRKGYNSINFFLKFIAVLQSKINRGD